MEKYLMALLLAGNKLNKRQVLVTLSLCLHYSYFKEKKGNAKSGSYHKITASDITAQTGINTHETALVLDSLCDYNIVGSVIYTQSVSSKQLVQGLSEEFIKSLGVIPPSKSNKTRSALLKPILKACDRAHFFILDDSKAYIFNPNVATWKYPTWKKIRRGAENIKEKFQFKEIEEIIKKYKKNKNGQLTTQENQDANYLIRQFIARFKQQYGSEYTINHTTEIRMIKTLIIQFERNGLKREEIPEFFGWAFEKKKGHVIHISSLRYLANEYIVSMKKDKPVDYEVDDWGNKVIKK